MKKIIILLISVLSGLLWGQSYSLEECVRIALENKVTIKSAEMEVKSAIAGKKATLSGVLPSVSFSGTAAEGNTFINGYLVNTGKWNSGINLNQKLFDGGNTWRNLTLGRNALLIAEESERLARINVILAVHRSYYQLLKNQRLLGSAREDLDLANQQLELVRQQFELGAVKKTDMLKAQVRYGQARTNVITQEATLDNAKRELANTMGVLHKGLTFTIEELNVRIPDPPDYEYTIKTLSEKNPSLIIQQYTIINRELNYKNTKGLRMPSITLSGGYNTTAGNAGDLLSDYSNNWSMSGQLSLSFPLFTGFQASVRSQQAKINLKTAQNDKTNIRDDLTVQVRGLLDVLRNYKEIIPVLEEVLLAAEEDLKLAKERYALGSAILLEVLDAQLSVTQARTNLINTTYDALIQDATLKATLGVLDIKFK